ncbi:MAG: hypothetical protein AAFX99_26955, partial [Myxococcota bacterium]
GVFGEGFGSSSTPYNTGSIAPPPPTSSAPPPPAAKKKGWGLEHVAMVGCLGMIVVMISCCGCAGYLLYLEEGIPYGEPTSDEVATAKVKEGKPFKLDFEWDGVNYASHDVWLVVEGKKSDGEFQIQGSMGCTRWGDIRPREFTKSLSDYGVARVKNKSKGKFSAWIRIYDEYSRSSSTPWSCAGTFKATQGKVSKAKLVVTQRQRPSDFMAF